MQEPDRILRIRTVLTRSGLSRSTLYRKIGQGTFPKQVRISEYCCGWRESEINRWVSDPIGWRPMSKKTIKLSDSEKSHLFGLGGKA